MRGNQRPLAYVKRFSFPHIPKRATGADAGRARIERSHQSRVGDLCTLTANGGAEWRIVRLAIDARQRE